MDAGKKRGSVGCIFRQLPRCLAAVLAAFFLPGLAAACVCDHNIDPCEALEAAEKVALVEVREIDESEHEQQVRLIVLEAFKGTEAGSTIPIVQTHNTCHRWFELGDRLLAFISTWRGNLQVSTCSGSSDPKAAADLLSFLRAGGRVGESGRLSVWLEHWESYPNEGLTFIGPIADSEVGIRGERTSRVVRTDSEGLLVVEDLEPGLYTIVSTPPAKLEVRRTLEYGGDWLDDEARSSFTVRVAPGKCSGGGFMMKSSARVTGIVLDSESNPVNDYCLALEPATGEADSWFEAEDCTDQDGRFVIGPVSPGTFVLSFGVSESDEESGLWFPGTAVRDDAMRIKIGTGERVDLGVFRLPRPDLP